MDETLKLDLVRTISWFSKERNIEYDIIAYVPAQLQVKVDILEEQRWRWKELHSGPISRYFFLAYLTRKICLEKKYI